MVHTSRAAWGNFLPNLWLHPAGRPDYRPGYRRSRAPPESLVPAGWPLTGTHWPRSAHNHRGVNRRAWRLHTLSDLDRLAVPRASPNAVSGDLGVARLGGRLPVGRLPPVHDRRLGAISRAERGWRHRNSDHDPRRTGRRCVDPRPAVRSGRTARSAASTRPASALAVQCPPRPPRFHSPSQGTPARLRDPKLITK